MYFVFMNSDVRLADGPITSTSVIMAIVKTNVNPDKDFLVTTKDVDEVQWKIFSAP